MAARRLLLLLLLLLFREGERNGVSVAAGLSEEERGSEVISSKGQHVTLHPESIEDFIEPFKEYKRLFRSGEGHVSALPNAALRLNDRRPNDFDFKDSSARQTVMLKHPASAAKALIDKHSRELTLSRQKRSRLSNGEAEGVIEALGLGEELRLETGVGGVRPEGTRGTRGRRSTWVSASQVDGSEPRTRRRRSWLWNQFFVIEEYRGPEPVLIGRVSCQTVT